MIAEEIQNTIVQRFHAQVYRINDLVGWADRNELVLSPSFQRRQIWTRQGKSYLIDSIVRGMPIPQFFIREIVHTRERRTVREVVDGQQRISTILDFVAGKFSILRSHNPELSGMRYAELPEHIQRTILSFPLSVNILTTGDDAEVLEIFSRINSYSVTLNRQEKLNATYTGAFKASMHNLARKHLAYWENHKILSRQAIARMGDVDLTADLVVTMMTGLHDSKKHIEPYYKKFDDEFSSGHKVASRFNSILELIEQLVGIDIENTEYRRVPLFYSLFTATYDVVFGIGRELDSSQLKLDDSKLAVLNDSLQEISDKTADRDTEGKFGDFIKATLSSTDKLPQRQLRHNFMKSVIKIGFN